MYDSAFRSNQMTHEMFAETLKTFSILRGVFPEPEVDYQIRNVLKKRSLLQAVEAPRVARGRGSHVTSTNG
jgi:hypothetical protein